MYRYSFSLELIGTSVITKVLLKVLDDFYESSSLALRFCLEDVAKDMFSKGLISESTMTTPNYDTVISEFKTGMNEKEDTPQLEKHCRLFLTCLSSQGGPAEAVAEELTEQWKDEVQKELNISLSLDVITSDQEMKQMESELVEANTEMTEHITTNETEHLEIRDHFNELLRQFKHELHGKLSKGEEKLSNITDFVQQLVSTEDLCDVKDLDEVVKKLDCYYNFLDCQIIVLFAERFASPALLQRFENHSKEAKMFCRSHTIKILQNSFDVNFDSHQTNASISLHIAWSNVIINGLYVLINQFSVKHESHIVLKHITVTESSVHIEYFMRNSSMEIEEVIAHAQKNVSFMKFMWFIGIYACTINEHIILQVDNEENFTFELALLNVARAGQNEAVQFLLDLTDTTDHCNEEGTTALMLASEGGYEPVVKSLLLAGANVNIQDNDGRTALLIASENNHITIVHTLLEVGADLDLQISKGANALIIACTYGHSNVVELLLNAQAGPNNQVSDGTGLTALMMACIKGHIKVVELLLNKKADTNIQDSIGSTALMIACINGHFKLVELLLNKNADPNIQDSDGCTALMLASEHGYSQIVELLLNKNADPNIQDSVGLTALMIACINGHFKLVELLLNKNADPNIQDSDGCTALMQASQHGYSQIVELLLKDEADPNIQNMNGQTALWFANHRHDFQVVEVLLNHHANPNIRDMHGYTELHFAVFCSMKRNSKFGFPSTEMTGAVEDYIKIIQLLIGHSSIDIDAVNDEGFTSLMCASRYGCTEVVELLLEAGANPNIQIKTSITMKNTMSDLPGDILLQPQCKSRLLLQYNNYLVKGMTINGTTALIFASFEGHLDIVQILLQAKAIPDLQNETGYTALLLAALKGHSDIVQQLLECGANPNISHRDCGTPLYAAVYCSSIRKFENDPIKSMECEIIDPGSNEDYLKIIQLLIDQPNVDIVVNTRVDGYTCLHIASKHGCIDAVKLLLQVSADPNIQTHSVNISNSNLSYLPSNIILQPHIKPINDFQTMSGFTALMLASFHGHTEIVQLLLNAKAKPDIQIENGETALYAAAARGYPDIVQLLLEYGADPNISNRDGVTATYVAASGLSIVTAKARGDNTIMEAVNTFTTLISGKYEHYLKTMKLLIGHSSIDIDAVNDEGLTSLMFASMNGCTEVVELLLEAGANLNMQIKTSTTMKNINGYTALMLASEHGYSQIVELLLNKNADPNIQNSDGCTALMQASQHGYSQIVELLLKDEADPNIQNMNGQTALWFANHRHDFQVVEVLLKHHANPNIKDYTGHSELHFAVLGPLKRDTKFHFPSTSMTGTVEDYIKIIQLLIGHSSIDIDAVNENGFTSLMFASMHGCTEAVELLLEAGANPNIQTKTSTTIKDLMSELPGDMQLQLPDIKSYFEKNVSQWERSNYGCTALMFASNKGHLDIVQMLLQSKAKPDLRDKNGLTALFLAAMKGHYKIVQQLLECGANPNISNRHDMTPLFAAVHHLSEQHFIRKFKIKEHEQVDPEDFFKIIQLLTAQTNILVNANFHGCTSLHIASEHGCTDVVKLLLQAGADPNIQTHGFERDEIVDNLSCLPSNILLHPQYKTDLLLNNFQAMFGFTALMFASDNGHSEIVQLLLNAKATPDLQTENGETALYLAAEKGYPDIVQLLLEYGADPNTSTRHGVAAIHAAMLVIIKGVATGTYECYLKTLKLLIAQPNIKINETILGGVTILMLASGFGSAQIVELLLQAGADPNIEQHIPVSKVFVTSCLPKTHTIGYTALMYASTKQKNSEVVKLLLKANANPNQENALALMIAADQGYLDIVQDLLEYGADPNSISDIDGSTALHYALKSQTETPLKAFIKLVIIRQLIEKGANIINIQNEDGLTAMMMATDKGLSEVVDLLLHNGADPNIHGDKGLTALVYACNHGNSKVAKSLLRYNANPQLVDNDGFTASIHALISGNKDLARELVNDRDFSRNELKCLLIMDLLEGDQAEVISRLDDITDLTTDKKELLISCVVGSLEDVISKLHESGLHPDTPLVGGLTLLMIASSCGYIELVEYLVIMEADVNQRDMFWKYTPLFYAILGSKSNEIVELLLKNGADTNAVAGNQTPLDMANSSPVENLISSLLIKHGGQTFSEMTSVKSEMQPPIKKKYAIFADLTNQVKSLIQDTVVKREHTEYELNI